MAVMATPAARRRVPARDPPLTPRRPPPLPAPQCDKGDIDLSTRALKAATGFAWDRKKVTWEYTSCSSGDRKSRRMLTN